MTVSLDEARLTALASSFSGSLLRPTDAAYEEVRRVHTALVDRRPHEHALEGREVAARRIERQPDRAELTDLLVAVHTREQILGAAIGRERGVAVRGSLRHSGRGRYRTVVPPEPRGRFRSRRACRAPVRGPR
mgnify:CR=1 FL=1